MDCSSSTSRGIAGVARQIDEFPQRAVGIVEIGARAVDDAALPVLLEGDLDAVGAQMVEGLAVLVMRDDEGMVHAAMVVEHRVNRRLALDQDQAGPGRIEKGHLATPHGLQMPATDDLGIEPSAFSD